MSASLCSISIYTMCQWSIFMDETLKQQKTDRPKEPSGFYWQFSHNNTRRSVFALGLKQPCRYEVAILWVRVCVLVRVCVWAFCNVWQGRDLACQQTPAINFDPRLFFAAHKLQFTRQIIWQKPTRGPWGASSSGSAAASSGVSAEASVMSRSRTKNAHSKILGFHVSV